MMEKVLVGVGEQERGEHVIALEIFWSRAPLEKDYMKQSVSRLSSSSSSSLPCS